MGVVLSSASQQFGRYQLLEFIGSGGMSDVFVALHTGLRKRVALKLLRPFLRRDANAVRRFLREGECAARVSHPNVVHVTDVGMENDIPYLVMELLEGETLEEKLAREGSFALEPAVDLTLTILEGLAATHAAGVLHRDIKPGNILLARTQDGSVVPKLVDFGIATLAERGNITGAIGPIGTPHYMSPEQARGSEIDFRSDLYSLASVLFELLTGDPPFGDGDVDEVLGRVVRGRFPRITDRRPSLPSALDDVLARATAYEPDRRFGSIEEMAHALLPFAGQRTRKLWISRDARAGVLSAHLLSGTWRAEDDAHATARIEVGAVVRNVARDAQAERPAFRWFVPAALGLCMAFAGVALRSELSPGEAPLAQPEGAVAAQGPGLAATDASALSPRTQRLVVLSPAHAEATLDGVPLGSGFVTLPALDDDRVHELRVAAPNYVPRVLFFKRTLDTTRIELKQH